MNKYNNRFLLAFTFAQNMQAVRVLRKNKENRNLKAERKSFTLHQLRYLLNGQF